MVRRCDGLLGMLLVLAVASAAWAQQGALDRTVLPIPEPNYPPVLELDARKVKPPPRFEVKAPAGEGTSSARTILPGSCSLLPT